MKLQTYERLRREIEARDPPPVERHPECFFNFLGWWHWSIGIHVDVRHPHLDLHLPFGFIRLGWWRSPTISRPRLFGWSAWDWGRRRRPEDVKERRP